MNKRLFLKTLAAGVLTLSLAASGAFAGTESVTADGGSFLFTLTKTAANEVTFSYSSVLLTSINGGAVGPIASTFGNATVTVLSSSTSMGFTSYTLSESPPGDKFFGTGATQTAELTNQVTNGSAVTGFLNLNGAVTTVSPLLQVMPTSTIYDFSTYNPGNITLTYTKNGADFASVIAGAVGGSISGNGSFTESAAVPEPASMALLGIGMTAMLAFRSYFKRSAHVA